MGTITDKLNKLAETKSAIKTAIVNKGVSISDTDTFASYADKIASISGGGSTPTEGIYGVFIYDTNGNLTKPEEWDTANNDLAVGVAVIDENCSFIIGKEASVQKVWSNQLNGTVVSGIVTTENTSIAKTDYAGEANSSIVRGLTPGENNAFNWAYDNTITVNGITLHGYLGALGEWQTAINNKSSINSALSKIGGTAMKTDDKYWSSTQYSANDAHMLDYGDDNVFHSPKLYNYYIRAFYHLDYPNSKIAIKKVGKYIIVEGSKYIISEMSKDDRILNITSRSFPYFDDVTYTTDASTLNGIISYINNDLSNYLPAGKLTIYAQNCTSINKLLCYNNILYPVYDFKLNIYTSDALKSLNSAFYYCNITDLTISNTSKVTDFQSMFDYASSLTNIGEIDSSSGLTFTNIFAGCEKLIKIASISLKSLDTTISNSYFTGWGTMPNLRYVLLKDFGTKSGFTSASFKNWPKWGIEDESVPLSAGARQSLIDTLITYSYDRATAGYSACSVTLHANTKALLTQDEIAQMTAKGYTLA